MVGENEAFRVWTGVNAGQLLCLQYSVWYWLLLAVFFRVCQRCFEGGGKVRSSVQSVDCVEVERECVEEEERSVDNCFVAELRGCEAIGQTIEFRHSRRSAIVVRNASSQGKWRVWKKENQRVCLVKDRQCVAYRTCADNITENTLQSRGVTVVLYLTWQDQCLRLSICVCLRRDILIDRSGAHNAQWPRPGSDNTNHSPVVCSRLGTQPSSRLTTPIVSSAVTIATDAAVIDKSGLQAGKSPCVDPLQHPAGTNT